MDYRKTAQDILDHVGGSNNIASAAHCATRLRFVIADNKKHCIYISADPDCILSSESVWC